MYNAASLTKPKQIQIQKREDLKLQPNEVLIRMAFAGVCGTDIAIYSGDYPIPLPRILGHEVSGIVDKVGSSDYNNLRDKPVVVEINNTCVAYRLPNLCPACQRELTNHCMTRTVLGIINYDGGFAEFLKVPIGNVHVLPSKISLRDGVFVEPVAAAFRTFELAPVKKEDMVVIFGIGRLGRLICAVAKEYGVTLIAVVHKQKSIEQAKKFGADIVLCSEIDNLLTNVKNLTQGLGADMVIEATGTPEGFTLAQDLVRPQGIISLKTTCGLPTTGINETKMVVDEVRIQGSRCGPFEKSIPFLEQGKLDTTSIISDILPISDTAQAIPLAITHSKVLISNS